MDKQAIINSVNEFVEKLNKDANVLNNIEITTESGSGGSIRFIISVTPNSKEEYERLLDASYRYHSPMNFTYDKHADVLYVTTNKNRPAYGDATCGGFVWRRAVDNGELVGVTCIDFKQGWEDNLANAHGLLCEKFPQYRVISIAELEQLIK